MKRCSRCKRTRRVSSFRLQRYRVSWRSSGWYEHLSAQCNDCRLRTNRESYARIGRRDRKLKPGQSAARTTRASEPGRFTPAELARLKRNEAALRARLSVRVPAALASAEMGAAS